ncbi:MAG: hypothetical protein LBQ01_02835 [Prevotellaceae bacterium]|jgi:hypothetical protein|nr:hypothetical protein [Prevotellaceae bacterium]
MNTAAVINTVNRLNAGVPHLIEEMERNSAQLERYIADADKNWHDGVKERFFSGPVTGVRQAHSSQTAAMHHIKSEFENAERQIFSMI